MHILGVQERAAVDTELEPGELEYVVRKFHDADTMHSYLSEKDGHNLLIRLSLPSTYIRSRRMPRSDNSRSPREDSALKVLR